MSAPRAIKIALVGAGMFGGDVHLPTYAQIARHGLGPWLGRVGLDGFAPAIGDVRVDLVALGTRTAATAEARRAAWRAQGLDFAIHHGEAPWEAILDAHPGLDALAVATPDHLHTAPILAALARGAHVITEKPMALDAREADAIVDAARAGGRIVAVDMHKRYDPDHLRLRDDLAARIGTPLYGRAVLEEPLSIPTRVFRAWAAESDPFSYVGCHWTDLYVAYFGVKPVSLHAVGQKRKLRDEHGIDAFDAVQVKVQFDNGMSIDFINNWIVPDAFEAPVNQESMLVGTEGMVESDSQYRGLRYATTGRGTQTANTHFTRAVRRPDGTSAFVGYGVDSLVDAIARIAQVKYLGATREDLAGHYPDAEQARVSVLIVHAAREVARLNHAYAEAGRGAPVTAVFDADGILVHDPYAGPRRIYDRPV